MQTVELIQHPLLEKHNLKRATRTLSWIKNFVNNNSVKVKPKRKKEPLPTNETEFELMEMINIYQNKHEDKIQFKQNNT